jgi:hypothetical protein
VVLVTHDPLVASRVDRVVTRRDGRASTDIRRRLQGGDGIAPPSTSKEEWVILDPIGRLQLPRTYVNTLEMRELVKVHLEPDHISISHDPNVHETAGRIFELKDRWLVTSLPEIVHVVNSNIARVPDAPGLCFGYTLGGIVAVPLRQEMRGRLESKRKNHGGSHPGHYPAGLPDRRPACRPGV